MVWPLVFTRIRPRLVLRRETVAFDWVALPATEPAARNPITPRVTVSVTTPAMRVTAPRLTRSSSRLVRYLILCTAPPPRLFLRHEDAPGFGALVTHGPPGSRGRDTVAPTP